MQDTPLFDICQSTPRKPTDYLTVLYGHCCVELSVDSMKVRRRMIIIVHSDCYPIETRYFRHRLPFNAYYRISFRVFS